MDTKDIEFQKRIMVTFRIEAEEHLNAFSAGLTELEKTQTEESLADIIETMFREIHSLKGAARSVDAKEVESICQPLESVFSALKRKEITLSPISFDLFYKTVEMLSKLTTESVSQQTVADRQIQRELIRQLKEITTGALNTGDTRELRKYKKTEPVESTTVTSSENESGHDIPKSAGSISSETVRIRISILEPLLLQAEELIQTKKAINQRINELHGINAWIAGKKAESLKWKVNHTMISSGLWIGWNEDNEIYLNKIESQLAGLTSSMERDQYNLDSMVDNHLEAMRQVLMLPVSSITEVFPGMVSEISHEQGKEIEFVIRGAELEIDKRILEELKDPLIHLIRNSIDHGIGKPGERILQNKPPRGTIILGFTALESGMVEISLSDDGNGINIELLLKAAIKSGNLSGKAAEKLDQKEILSLIFQSGVSTSSIITDISGRGLGLSIVHEKVEKLNGRISVETEVNKGTTFHILLPMTIATIRGILIRIHESLFIIPTMNVERVMKVEPEEIRTIENHETILIDDQILLVADLGEVLGLPEHKHNGSGNMKPGMRNSDQIRIVVLFSGERRMAFKVDDVVNEQQVLVKGLGKLLNRVRNISGATILGTGKVVPVLNIPDLMKCAGRLKGRKSEASASELFVSKTGKILVVEDSITSRTFIKNILETAGYQVTTSVDGVDAFTKASNDDFDIVVSDVDMPRMNGFELTAKIKHDKKLSEVPVVLVTALGSREDRERGIEVGADAYLVKSSFDQTNLLEIIRRLI